MFFKFILFIFQVSIGFAKNECISIYSVAPASVLSKFTYDPDNLLTLPGASVSPGYLTNNSVEVGTNIETLPMTGHPRTGRNILITTEEGEVTIVNPLLQLIRRFRVSGNISSGWVKVFKDGTTAIVSHESEKSKFYITLVSPNGQSHSQRVQIDAKGLDTETILDLMLGFYTNGLGVEYLVFSAGDWYGGNPIHLIDSKGNLKKLNHPSGYAGGRLRSIPTGTPDGKLILGLERHTIIIDPENISAAISVIWGAAKNTTPFLYNNRMIVANNLIDTQYQNTSNGYKTTTFDGKDLNTNYFASYELELNVAKLYDISPGSPDYIFTSLLRSGRVAHEIYDLNQTKISSNVVSSKTILGSDWELDRETSYKPVTLENGKVVAPILTIFRNTDSNKKRGLLQYYFYEIKNLTGPTKGISTEVDVEYLDEMNEAFNLEPYHPVLIVDSQNILLQFINQKAIMNVVVDSNTLTPKAQVQNMGFADQIKKAGRDSQGYQMYLVNTLYGIWTLKLK